ncbi:MAG: tRNA-(ms[2]io[6]A)-hydroxylase [Polyangiales bacterium]
MLGLSVVTDEAWIHLALANVGSLLADHAHCEMKAASNALSLIVHHNDRPHLIAALTAIAQEELAHFQRVHTILVARNIALGPPPVDHYAAAMRKATVINKFRKPVDPRCGPEDPQNHRDGFALVDRLLVSALIEARSCERFRLLSVHAADPELRDLYADLLESEASHYRVFLDLALAEGQPDGIDPDLVRARLKWLSSEEANLVQALTQPSSPPSSLDPPSSVRSRAAMHG